MKSEDLLIDIDILNQLQEMSDRCYKYERKYFDMCRINRQLASQIIELQQELENKAYYESHEENKIKDTYNNID